MDDQGCTSVAIGSNPRQRLLLASASEKGGIWLVVIHGGAWRDSALTDETGRHLMLQFRDKFNGAASVDYRLSPEFKHPAHALDVLHGIDYIVENYHPEKIVLLGHSAGAFLAGQVACTTSLHRLRDLDGREIAHDAPATIETGSSGEISNKSLPHLAIVGLEGIYSLHDLVAEYPDYRYFVEDAFGPEANWTEASPDWSQVSSNIVALQSKKDELLSLRQTQWLESTAPNVRVVIIPSGKHDEVFEKMDLRPYLGDISLV